MRFAGLPHRREALAHRRERGASTSKAAISARSSGSARLHRRAERHRLPAPRPMPADHLAFVAEEIFGDVPALVHFADDLVLGHLHVVEEGFAEGGRLPLISRIGLVETPGVAMSNSRKLMPPCLDSVEVRTRQKIQSALSA